MFFLLALALSACTSDSTAAPDTPAAVPSSLAIADPGLVRDGDVRILTAEARDVGDRLVPNVPIQWATTDPTVAVVTTAGLLTALREGHTEIVATAGTLQHRRLLSVVLHPAISIEVGAAQLIVPLGTRGGVTATLRGLDGRTLLHRPLEFSSSDPSIVRSMPNGELVPQKPGISVITVRYGSLSAAVTVRVPGEIDAVVHTVRDVGGVPLPAIIEEHERHEGAAVVREITRLDSGIVVLGETYDVTLSVAHYERTELNGTVTERLVFRQNVRDFGSVVYNWITGSAALESAHIGGLTHALDWVASGPQLRFREPGMPTIWTLGLRAPAP